MFSVTITLTEEQQKRAETLAHQHGFSRSDEYLHSLIEDALEGEPTDDEIIDALKDSLREAKRGEGMSVEEFRRWMSEDD
jgi:predicted transcriptional regulator